MAGLKFNKKRSPRDEDDQEDLPKRKKKIAAVEDDLELDDDVPFDADDELEEGVDDESEPDDEDGAPVQKKSLKAKPKAAPEKKTSGEKKSFLKTGAARAAMFKAEEAKDEMREKQYSAGKRFYIPKDKLNESFLITFIDGDLADDGSLDTPIFYEHFIMMGNRPMQFVSCCDDEPDPLQEAGKEPYLCQIFTVIDHNGYVDKEGKEHKHLKRLLGAKKTTIKQLNKIAAKRGGLAGATFEVSRSGKKSPNVGDTFDFEGKQTPKEIAKFLISEGLSKEDAIAAVKPFDYDEVLVQYSAAELVKLGLADKVETISSSKASKDLDAELSDEDFDD